MKTGVAGGNGVARRATHAGLGLGDMDWITKGAYWANRVIDWIVDVLKTITDPRWLMSHPGWAALLGLVVVFIVGWLFLFRGKRI